MRVIVIGLGVQGKKRAKFAKTDLIATIDPLNPRANFKDISQINLSTFDAAIVCTPESYKVSILSYLLENKKHVLVEKPLLPSSDDTLLQLQKIAFENKVICYTAYNHRFEPHFVRMRNLIDSGVLGKIYSCRMFYGNGTAKLVRDSIWRDQGSGVFLDLGSHLIDTVEMWFGKQAYDFKIIEANRFENSAPDHVIINSKNSCPRVELEMTFCMWKNHFTCDVLAEKGSAHIESLCKWGPSKFSHRERVFPSGLPIEKQTTLLKEDPTWREEYNHFSKLILSDDFKSLENDIWLFDVMKKLRF